MPTCKQCNQPFILGQIGTDILRRLDVPEPSVCDVCAVRQLMAFRNERTFYSSQCQKCSKTILSMYPPDTALSVYCRDCWWGDTWDGTQFGRVYRGPETFFQELAELQKVVPREGLVNLNSPDCDYCNHVRDCKSCYMCSLLSDQCEECYYCYWIVTVKDSAACYYGRNNQRCYFCVATIQSYGCSYVLECENCLDCHYSFDLRGCKNCMFSSNLRNQQYVFENQQLTKTEYETRAAAVNRGSWQQSRDSVQRWHQLIDQAVKAYSYQSKCENSTGDNIQSSVNTQLAYNSFEDENAYNAASVICAKNIFNGFAVGSQPTEWASNIAVVKGGTQIVSCFNTAYSSDIYFCENLISCMDCIGCIGLHKKKYCILNTQYEEEEYKKIKAELLGYLRQSGALSEFFPKSFSPFAYNETAAQDFYPLTKEQAVQLDYTWKDELPGTFGHETLPADGVPDRIAEVNDDILRQTLACIHCGRNFKLIKQELTLYRSLGVPIPRECFNCTLRQRLDLMGERDLRERQCDCTRAEHQQHQGKTCQNKFLTKYTAKDKKVYCEECYQKEIY
ncbi:hypothetical protein HY933_03665 [Candidatus Falkowbacteria bacterium]|nr:hypothetical protein [Candidatus Falkowbacteria bacterium]